MIKTSDNPNLNSILCAYSTNIHKFFKVFFDETFFHMLICLFTFDCMRIQLAFRSRVFFATILFVYFLIMYPVFWSIFMLRRFWYHRFFSHSFCVVVICVCVVKTSFERKLEIWMAFFFLFNFSFFLLFNFFSVFFVLVAGKYIKYMM